jgi:4-hydroxy-3-methylbut-2-enyl diphosphate reductase IspH
MGLALCPLIALGAVDSGSWSLSPADQGRLQFSLQGSRGSHHFDTSSDWQLTDFRGLDWTGAGKHDVHFAIARDAGTIDCQGFVADQHGAGLFTFKPNPQYMPEMQKLGYTFNEEELFSAATFDVSFEFARAFKTLAVQRLDAEKLIAFRIHGVTPEFVRSLRSEGLKAGDADKLIAFRIHGVSPEFVNGLRGAGIAVSDEDELVAFRIHGVSAEFAGELNHLGYLHTPPEQLIALRIHGVTPEYIESLRSKGLQNLTLDQLINMRIHGID